MTATMYRGASGRGLYQLGVTIEEARALKAATERLAASTPGDLIRRAIAQFLRAHAPDLMSEGTFVERRRKVPYHWERFDEDVRAWAEGRASIDQFLREGRSRAALLVRFSHRAQELGLMRPGSRNSRDEQARRVLRKWLDTDYPTPGNRKTATVYLKHPHWTGAAQELGVSRQRIAQVIRAARMEMGMAEVVKNGFPRPDSAVLDVSRWADGQVWKLMQGEDFSQAPQVFLQQVRSRVKALGLLVKTQRDLQDSRVLYVRIYRAAAPEQAAQ